MAVQADTVLDPAYLRGAKELLEEARRQLAVAYRLGLPMDVQIAGMLVRDAAVELGIEPAMYVPHWKCPTHQIGPDMPETLACRRFRGHELGGCDLQPMRLHPAHPTCLDASPLGQQSGSAFVCGPDCPPRKDGADG